MKTTTEQEISPGLASANMMICGPDPDAWIAECAYYKAEKRGFAPGHELDDWYEAVQERQQGQPVTRAAKKARAA
jgi:Protein of unknown function (DUF2934)